MGKAWDDAVALLMGNLGLIATVLGIFYFLPAFTIALLFPEISNPTPPEIPPGASPEAAIEIFSGYIGDAYAGAWPFLIIGLLAQFAGAIATLALFSDRGAPTVGEAIKTGIQGTPSYLASQVIVMIGVVALISLIGGLAIAISPLLGIPVILLMVVGFVYIAIKLTLVPAIIGMEGVLNPIAAMKRSWVLTKGNSILLFVFFLVLLITVGLIAVISSMVFGTIFSIVGGTAGQIGTSFFSSLIDATTGGIFLIVVAAIHRQLSSSTGDVDAETFE